MCGCFGAVINDLITEYQLPSSLMEQVLPSVDEHCEVADAELLQAVMAMEQTDCDDELSDDALMSAAADAEQNC